jgi:LysM repeat protein
MAVYLPEDEQPIVKRRMWLMVAGAFVLLVLIAGGLHYGCHGRGDETPEGSDTPPATPTEDRVSQPAPSAAAASPGSGIARPRDADEPDPGPRLWSEAQAFREQDDLEAARQSALTLLERSLRPDLREAAEAFLGEVHTELVFTPRPMREKEDYTIRSGDTLSKLAKVHGTTVEMIQRGNGLTGATIRAGDRLRVFRGRFSLHIDKSDNSLVVRLGDSFFKRYRVGTGAYDKTPVGEFKIEDRIPQPTWWRPDGRAIPFGHPDNELGTHWLSLDLRGYGIHGTWEPETVGTDASAGCIRLLNEDIQELYDLLPVGTPVTITD